MRPIIWCTDGLSSRNSSHQPRVTHGSRWDTIAGAPSYLRRFGVPRTAADLENHNRLSFGYARAVDGWPLRKDRQTIVVPTTGHVQASDGEALRQLALAGVGLARLGRFTVRDDIKAGRLIPVLENLNPGDREVFHSIHVGPAGPLPSRVRALLDFLAEHGRVR